MDIYSLTKRAVMRQHTQHMDDTDLRKLGRHIEKILEERAQARKVEAEKAKKRAVEIESIAAMMAMANITPEEITEALIKRSKKIPPTAPHPRYRTTDDQGREVLWSGKGRPPKAMAEQFKAGVKKEDLLIETELKVA